MKTNHLKKGSTFAAATAIAFAVSISLASAASFTLKIGSGQPMKPLEPINQANYYFVPTIEKRVAAETSHKIKFIKLWSTVSSPFDVLENVQKKLFDIGLFCACFEPTKASQLAFHYYLPMVTDDPVTQLKITRKVYSEFPEWEGDTKKFNQTVLGAPSFSSYGIGTTFAWKKVTDLAGHKLAGAGLNLPWLKLLSDVTVIQTNLNEAYNSLQSGVYEGVVIFPPAWKGFKLDEPAKFYTEVGWGATTLYQMTINNDTWASFPSEIKKIFNEEKENWMLKASQMARKKYDSSLAALKKDGSTLYKLPYDQRAAMAKAYDSWANDEAKKLDAKGLPASKLFRRYLNIAEEAGIKLPHKYNIK